jgi:CO/xanthine dehydrogenase Mo-binding subunit
MRVEGQIQGGAMQGLGYALTEDMGIEDGYVQAAQFANYLIPNAEDFPEVLVDIVESGEGKGPLGARGIGEPTSGTVKTFPDAEITMESDADYALASPGALNSSGNSFTDTWDNSY